MNFTPVAERLAVHYSGAVNVVLAAWIRTLSIPHARQTFYSTVPCTTATQNEKKGGVYNIVSLPRRSFGYHKGGGIYSYIYGRVRGEIYSIHVDM